MLRRENWYEVVTDDLDQQPVDNSLLSEEVIEVSEDAVHADNLDRTSVNSDYNNLVEESVQNLEMK